MQTLVFYDGECGLCHRTVRFLLARDPDGSLFRFAPLFGKSFDRMVPADRRAGLADSVVVRTRDGQLLQRAAGVFYLLKRIGGVWRAVGTVGGWLPAALTDGCYDRVAAARKQLFARPDDLCPVVPAELRSRFEL